jgi:hypothetical protein
MPTVNGAPPSLVCVASPRLEEAPRRAPSRLRRAAAFARLAASDVVAVAGAVAAMLPLLPRRRPLGRALPGAPPAAGEPERLVLPR